MRHSQRERIEQTLEGGEWVCGTTFLKMGIPRYAARMLEIRQQRTDWTMERRKCRSPYHQHLTNQQFEWRVVPR